MKKNNCYFCGKLENEFDSSWIKVYYEDEPENYMMFCCDRHYSHWVKKEIRKVKELALSLMTEKEMKKWLHTPNKKMENKNPANYIKDTRNREKVISILNKMKFGIPE